MSEQNSIPLSESLLNLKGHTIDEVKVTETKDGLHVIIDSTKPSEVEPENMMAITYSHMSFLIPK